MAEETGIEPASPVKDRRFSKPLPSPIGLLLLILLLYLKRMISDEIKRVISNPTINDAVALGIVQEFEKIGIKHWGDAVSPVGIFTSDGICFRLSRATNDIKFTLIKPTEIGGVDSLQVGDITLDPQTATIKISRIHNTKYSRSPTVIEIALYSYADPKCFEKVAAKIVEIFVNQS